MVGQGLEEPRPLSRGAAAKGMVVVGEVVKEKPTSQRPSSAPHLSSRLSSSSLSGSTKSHSSCAATRKGKGASWKTGSKDSLSSADEKRSGGGSGIGRERSRSSTDITRMSRGARDEGADSVQSLRSNVQRLHQEVCLRVSQEAYIVQGLMNHAEGLNDHHNNNDSDKQTAQQIRRRLSFDEDAPPPSSDPAQNRHVSHLGKWMGVGTVGTGVVAVSGTSSEGGGGGGGGGAENLQNGPSVTRSGRKGRSSSDHRRAEQATHTTDSWKKKEMQEEEEEEESSFLASAERLSETRATSTPRKVGHRQRPASSLSSLSSSSYAVGGGGGRGKDAVVEGDVVPVRETSSNLRARRPASVGAIPFRSSSLSSLSATASASDLWPGGFSGSEAADFIVSQLGNASMVHLLQQLYTADDATRQAIILKAQYFKHWQRTVQSLKQQRQIYAESLKRAHKYLISRLQRRCFLHWRGAADASRKDRMAEGIHRQHMLRKGLQGFRWAILRSKHQIRTLQMRVSALVTRTAFDKWQAQFESRREERLCKAFRRWREYAYEEKIVREKQKDQNEKLVCVTMLLWREAYDRRMKENVADKYLRRTSLLQSWRVWRQFTNSAKEKAYRHSLALDLRKRNMQRSTLQVWRLSFIQSQRASHHFRKRRLRRIVQAWRQGAQISHVERQRDMAGSAEHWRRTTTRHTFLRWHHHLLLCRAVAMDNRTLFRKTFDFWRQSWQTNTQRRQRVEATITRSRLRKSLMTWRRHVLDRRRKQRRAVCLLETCLMRVTVTAWRRYTAFKTGFRASLQLHVRVIQGAVLTRCFHLWRDALHVRLDERRRQELWSLTCVRKMTAIWRHKCHVRRLHVTLEETEPERELALLRRTFGQWLTAKGRADQENGEVEASRRILQRCSLQRRFQEWRLAAQRALTIRPLVLRRQRLLVTWCFDAWHQFIKGRMERHTREKIFQKNRLSRAFTRWKRQYHCQQVSRLAQQGFTQRLALCLLHHWCAILHRKHRARLCHTANLLRRSFRLWHRRTGHQLREKAERLEEEELSQTLKRRYLGQWWSGVRAQVAGEEEAVASLQQRHHHNHILSAFSAWRRSLHAHVISRAYQRTMTQRLLLAVLQEWREASSQSLQDAVQRFAQQIGLQVGEEEEEQKKGARLVDEDGESEESNLLDFKSLMQFGETDQFDNSPCSSSTASLKQLFASDQSTASERMLGSDLDLDRASLLTSGLLETMEERRQKNLRLQGLSMTFVARLRHWPVSLAFSQWQDYTLRQRHLRGLGGEVGRRHRAVTVGVAFRQWRLHLGNSRKATSLRNWKLQHGTLTALLEYSRHRKVKAVLAERARGHLVKNVLGRIFPWWLEKAQQQRHQRTVLHLWSTATPEEAQLLPLEASLSRQIRHRSLRACLGAWRVRFLFLSKLKGVYHAVLLGRVLCTWQDWASLRQHQRKKGDNFLQARRKSLVFRTWCERLHQKRETERRYQAALEGYLRLVFRCWRDWATVSKRHRQSRAVLERQVNGVCVRTHFDTWRRLTQHSLTVRNARHAHLLRSVLLGWRQATMEGKQLRQTILSFQARSLTRLVGQLFHRWRLSYHHRQRLHRQREERAQQSALTCGRHWRHLAQKTRGRKLVVVFRYNRLWRMFHHWHASLARVEELKRRQGALVERKNGQTMRRLLGEWRQRLQSAVLLRGFSLRLMATLLQAWHLFARGSKERRIRGLALQHALQERNMRVYFLYWRQMSVRVRSLQNNVEVRLQLRVLQAWSYATRRRCSQRRLGEKFARLRQERLLAASFYSLRTRFDYCQGLRDMADSMCARRDRLTALQAMQRWKDALDNVMAQRFYQRLVSVRTARTWLRYVMRVKAERKREEEQRCKAVAHHNKTLCRSVIEGLKQEVKVKRQLQRRQQRIAIKFAGSWKRIADLSVTAALMEEERLYGRYWRCWRLAFVRTQAASKDTALCRRQLLSQVFTSWHSLCPSRRFITLQDAAPGRRSARATSVESPRDGPPTPRSFLPVPVATAAASRRHVYDS
ncbi:uncharacterized protein LOC143302115 [Babylonia areolata]|uniref:uncharacterized protein LOC143302115 n=1 Tax=Babylonia areolata TaxID=304850 RepID=UPI003FD0A904